MLEQKDLQSIGELLDKKLDERFKIQGEEFEEKLEEMAALVNKGFTDMQKEIELRPTKKEIFEWADGRLLDLELRADRHDYLHIGELDKLPPPAEISRLLVEKGFKKMK